MKYLTDGKRHLICEPYSIQGLHDMAADLRLHRCWFHNGQWPHYDIPKLRHDEIVARCLKVSSKEILRVIKESRLV